MLTIAKQRTDLRSALSVVVPVFQRFSPSSFLADVLLVHFVCLNRRDEHTLLSGSFSRFAFCFRNCINRTIQSNNNNNISALTAPGSFSPCIGMDCKVAIERSLICRKQQILMSLGLRATTGCHGYNTQNGADL